METVKSVLPTAVILALSYGAMEVLHHSVINGMLAPWLMSLGLTSSVISGLTIAAGIASILAISFIVVKCIQWYQETEKKVIVA